MPITTHQNETLENLALCVEEHQFNNCRLVNCQLIYDGGPFHLANTSFLNCQWQFRERAHNTVQLLQTIGLLQRGQAPPQNIPKTTGGLPN